MFVRMRNFGCVGGEGDKREEQIEKKVEMGRCSRTRVERIRFAVW